ncbi:MAG: hypothetical protein U0R44_01550 [Candidatus Micrarchaeia archaeon]
MQKEQKIEDLAGRIRRSEAVRDTLAKNYGLLSREEQLVVIAAVVKSGISDDPLVRTIRGTAGFSALKAESEGPMGGPGLENLIRGCRED